MANPFVYVELNTTDVEKAKTFYGRLFDWQMEDVNVTPVGHYTRLTPGQGPGGGMMKQMMPNTPSFWLAYVEVPDVGAATKKAQSLGAKVMVDSKEIPGEGTLSIITDPTGAMLGLWKSKA
jgi:uncharacterized protein